MDEADQMVNLAQKLRNLQINPRMTHIPEFADDIPKHIELIEEGIRKSGKDGEEMLKTLADLKKEALEKIRNQEVTYAWWLEWNSSLARIEYGNQGNPLNRTLNEAIDSFPDIILLPTTSDLGITAMNRDISQRVFPLALQNKTVLVDGKSYDPFDLFYHDVAHAREYLLSKESVTSSIEERYNINLYQEFQKLKFSSEQSERINNIYFQIWHEMEMRISEDLTVTLPSKARLVYRFQKEGDLRELLPDSVNADSKEAVGKYLDESMSLFERLTRQVVESL